MALPKYKSTDDLIQILRKILQSLTGTTGASGVPASAGLVEVISGGGNPVQTLGDVTTAGAAVEAIPAGSSGYITAPSDLTGSLFVGGSDVTNNSGTKRGMELIAGGMTPRLTGPVYVIGSSVGLKAGVITS